MFNGRRDQQVNTQRSVLVSGLQSSQKHQAGGSPDNGGDSTAQNHPNEISVSAKLLAVNKIAVDMCGHCNKTCEASGVNGEDFQCDLCEGWFHASCENISSKHYKSFSTLAKSIPNMVYYCKHNKCQSRIMHIVAEFTRSLVMGSSQILDKLRDEQEEINNSLSDKYESLAQSVNELSSKINSLVSRNCTLQMEIDSATEPPSASNTLASSGPSDRTKLERELLLLLLLLLLNFEKLDAL